MDISLCKINNLNWKNFEAKTTKYKSDLMVLTIDFLQNKKQIESLLFFDKLAKTCKQFLIIFDVDYEKCVLKNVIVLDNKKYKIIIPDFAIGGFVLRFFDTKIAFVFGDNIYRKSYRNFVKNNNYKNIVHIDLFDEGVIFEEKFYKKNTKIISTKNSGIYRLKN
jgi:hypothetical protein